MSLTTAPPAAAAASPPITFIGAGDIADTVAQAEATAKVLDAAVTADLGATVWTAGDNAYENATATDFATKYEPTWGRHRNRTRPVPGNHEYQTANATGHFNYFCPSTKCVIPGGTQQKYYSYNLGNWHIVSLNSEIEITAGSPQMTWLQNDLGLPANRGRCIAAIFHKPYYNSGTSHGRTLAMKPFWDILYAAKADLVLNGHEHVYERFAKQNPNGAAAVDGIRQFTVGTGGAALNTFGTIAPNSQARGTRQGVVKFTLNDTGYQWSFVPVAGATYSDTGSQACNNSGGDAVPASAVTAPAANAVVKGSFDLTANATDNNSVGGVQFKVDGINVGTEDTTSPYSVTWNTTTVSEGQHNVTAVARDNAGQTTSSHMVTVTVDNVADTTTTIEKRVGASSDDAEQGSGGATVLNSTDLELVTDAAVQTVGTRFTGVTVPRGATIKSAYVQFMTDETSTATTPLTIQAQASDSAATFTTATNNVSSRARTTASASWSPPAWNVVDEAGAGQRTPNLSSVVQEVTNRTGWASGNALALIVTGSGRRVARAFDFAPGSAPLLHIEYETGSAAPTTQTLTFTPTADATVQSAAPTMNFGSATILEVDSSPLMDFLVRFQVTVPAGKTVTGAKLRLYDVEASVKGGDVYRTADTTWSGTAVTWTNAPAADATPLGSLGAVALNTWYEVDVKQAVTGTGAYSFRVRSTNSDGADYRSQDGGSATAPQLVLTVQ